MISLPEHFEHVHKPQRWTCQQWANLSVPGDAEYLAGLLAVLQSSGFITDFGRSIPTIYSNRYGGTEKSLFLRLECPGMLGGETCLRRALQERFGIKGDYHHCLKPRELI